MVTKNKSNKILRYSIINTYLLMCKVKLTSLTKSINFLQLLAMKLNDPIFLRRIL